jgi:hypothetical protein
MRNINVINDYERVERIAFINKAFDDMLKILDSCIDRTHLSDELNVRLDAASERRAALKELIKQSEQHELDRLYNL